MSRARSDTWERFYAVVGKIPRGRVATYGQVAEWAGLPGYARQVGWALHALRPGSRVPWQRVVNARGACSVRPGSGSELEQRRKLEREGVAFGAAGRIDLTRYGWRAEAGAKARAKASGEGRARTSAEGRARTRADGRVHRSAAGRVRRRDA